MPISERNKQFIIIGITIAIIAVGVFLGYNQYGKVVEAQKVVKKADMQLQEEQEELDNLRELSQSLEDMSIEMDSVKQVLPNGIAVPELLTNLEAIATHSEVTFNGISVSSQENIAKNVAEGEKSAAPTGVQTLPVTVSITGDYLNVKRYLTDIESNMRLLDVNSITSSGEGIFDISMTAYYVE